MGPPLDLVLDMGAKHGVWAIEIKYSEAPKLTKGNHHAFGDIEPNKAFVVHSGHERFPLTDTIEAISLQELTSELLTLN